MGVRADPVGTHYFCDTSITQFTINAACCRSVGDRLQTGRVKHMHRMHGRIWLRNMRPLFFEQAPSGIPCLAVPC